MHDLSHEIPYLQKLVHETDVFEDWATKNEKLVAGMLSIFQNLIDVSANQKLQAKKALDAIEYLLEDGPEVQKNREKLWEQIAVTRTDNAHLIKEIEKTTNQSRKKVLPIEQGGTMNLYDELQKENSKETAIFENYTETPYATKRRRSFARTLFDNFKEKASKIY